MLKSNRYIWMERNTDSGHTVFPRWTYNIICSFCYIFFFLQVTLYYTYIWLHNWFKCTGRCNLIFISFLLLILRSIFCCVDIVFLCRLNFSSNRLQKLMKSDSKIKWNNNDKNDACNGEPEWHLSISFDPFLFYIYVYARVLRLFSALLTPIRSILSANPSDSLSKTTKIN